MRRLCALALFWALASSFAAPRQAFAQTTAELHEARAKFQKALALQTAGDWAGALKLLKEVAEVKSTPQVRFNIALTEEKLGQLVAALGDYELAASDAREADLPKVAESAYERLESLRARIPKVIVERGAGAEAALITIDGVTLGERVIGAPMPVDPGPHVIEASAANQRPFSTRVTLDEGETERIVVELEPVRAPDQPPPPPPQSESSNTAAYIVGSVGIASLAASGVFFVLREQAKSELDELCPDLSCPPDVERDQVDSTIEEGETYTLLGNVALGVGVVGVGTGLVMLLTSGSDSTNTNSTTPRVSPSAPGALAGLSVQGSF